MNNNFQSGQNPNTPPYNYQGYNNQVPPPPQKKNDSGKIKLIIGIILGAIIIAAVAIILICVMGGDDDYDNLPSRDKNGSSASSISDDEAVTEQNTVDSTTEEITVTETTVATTASTTTTTTEAVSYPRMRNEKTAVTAAGDIQKYQPYLEVLQSVGKGDGYFLCDLNSDGIPELFVTNNTFPVSIYTILNEKVQDLTPQNSFYLTDNKYICESGGGGGLYMTRWSEYKGGNQLTRFVELNEAPGDNEKLYSYSTVTDTVGAPVSYEEYIKLCEMYDCNKFVCTPTPISEVKFTPQSAAATVSARIEGYSSHIGDGLDTYLKVSGDFSYIKTAIWYNNKPGNYTTHTKDQCKYSLYLMSYSSLGGELYFVEVIPYDENNNAGESVICYFDNCNVIPLGISPTNKKGEISCKGNVVPGFKTSYICHGGPYATERKSLGDTWHITAMYVYSDGKTTWYQLWDTDDGDYYGWVNSKNILFY